MEKSRFVQNSTTGHGGDVRHMASELGVRVEELLDFSANINPLGPPSWLRSLIARELDRVTHYPDPLALKLRTRAATHFVVPVESVLAANGTTELLYLLPSVLQPKRVIVPCPSYIDYVRVAELAEVDVKTIELLPEQGFRLDCDSLADQVEVGDLVIIGSPNNPTATLVDYEDLRSLARSVPGADFLVDEAF
ncbi:MAG: aminotransferase class I/II-fold pyridoxal phosphate-dependent enzyme, partial [Thermodesulfobacteriota bacterium]